MNNMESIDQKYNGDNWERKRQFLSEYKFTISFENYVYPGYQTEKLYDSMRANSIPLYCGDPNVGEVFNKNSFINVVDISGTNNSSVVRWLEKISQADFMDMRPAFYHNPLQRLKRKIKSAGRELKMKKQFNNLNFSEVIKRIIQLDTDDEKYISMLNQPWFNHNTPPADVSTSARWIEIFGSK